LFFYFLAGSSLLNCNNVRCIDPSPCPEYAEIEQVEGLCCPLCVCTKKCPQLNDKVCSVGFKPVRKPKYNQHECCDSIQCISKDDDSIHLNIRKNPLSSLDDPQLIKYYSLEDQQDYLDDNDDDNDNNDGDITLNINPKMFKNETKKFEPFESDLPVDHNYQYDDSCNYDGELHLHLSTWKPNPCTNCKCETNQITCEPIICPSQLDCEVKKTFDNECCPVCTGQCLSLNGSLVYERDERWRESNDCIDCVCTNGSKLCHAESCNILTCENPIKLPGVCCKQCPNESTTTPILVIKSTQPPDQVVTKQNNTLTSSKSISIFLLFSLFVNFVISSFLFQF
jgi:hypothetical protein